MEQVETISHFSTQRDIERFVKDIIISVGNKIIEDIANKLVDSK